MNLKILFIGDGGCGKSTLIYKILYRKWLLDIYDDSFYNEDSFNKEIARDEKKYNLVLTKYNTSNEEFYAIGNQFLKNSDLPVFVFSLSNQNSLNALQDLISRNERVKDEDDPIFIILGLKSDLDRTISSEEIEKILKLSKNSRYMEFSTKTNDNTDELLMKMIQFYTDQKNKKTEIINNVKPQKKGLFASISNQNDAKDDLDLFNSLNK